MPERTQGLHGALSSRQHTMCRVVMCQSLIHAWSPLGHFPHTSHRTDRPTVANRHGWGVNDTAAIIVAAP